MKVLVATAVTLAIAASALPSAHAAEGDAADRCHQAIARGQAAVKRGRIAQVGRCLKSLAYDTCIETDSHTAIHENELRNHVAGASGECQAALDAGAVVADFGPPACESSWENCDVAVPAVTTLDDIAECLICQERGYDFEIRHELGMPRPAPADPDERRCTRRLARLVTTTIRKAVLDTAACASGGAKPFACPVDPTPESRFGKSLAKFARNVGACRVDEGKAPGTLANLCGGTAGDAAGLTLCLEGLAKCLACRTANSALGQDHDCTALSGFADCDGAF